MSQADILERALADGTPKRSDVLVTLVYGSAHLGLARLAARVHDLRKRGLTINGWRDKRVPSLYWYQLVVERLEDHAQRPLFDGTVGVA